MHKNGPSCVECDIKLQKAHEWLRSWFYFTRALHEDCHISCSFRNKAEQLAVFNDGKSKAIWPKSKHNKIPSEALDIFRLGNDGKAYFEENYYKKIAEETKDAQYKIKWGGDFKGFKDMPHFELNEKEIDMADEKEEVKVPVVDEKKPWESKVLWTNAIIAILAIFYPPAKDFIYKFPDAFAVFWSVINIVLRFVTKDKLTIKD